MKYSTRAVTALVAVVAIAGFVFSAEADHHTPIEQAVASADRPEADRERDVGRKPAAVLAFYGVEPGMTVVDLHSGGGYFTRILSDIVGDEGRVIAHNGTRTPEDRRPAIVEQYAGMDNVDVIFTDPEAIDAADGSVDVVLLILVYHHWHYNEANGEDQPKALSGQLANVYRMLKPGGVFGIIEHLAPEGSGRAASAANHRVPEDIAIMDLTGAGFRFEGASDIHDDHDVDDINIDWHDTTPRGETRRFVHLYRKPAE